MERRQQELTVDRLFARLAELERENARLQREYARLGGLLRERLAGGAAESGRAPTPGAPWPAGPPAPGAEHPEAPGSV